MDRSPKAQDYHNRRQFRAEQAAEAIVTALGGSDQDPNFGQRVQDAIPAIVEIEQFLKQRRPEGHDA